jgi:hypothetical protein
MCCLDVALLFPFVAAAEQDYKLIAMRSAINPVSGAVVDAQLEDALPYRFPVAAKADAQSIDSRQYARTR